MVVQIPTDRRPRIIRPVRRVREIRAAVVDDKIPVTRDRQACVAQGRSHVGRCAIDDPGHHHRLFRIWRNQVRWHEKVDPQLQVDLLHIGERRIGQARRMIIACVRI